MNRRHLSFFGAPRGFSLIELMVVISISALIAAATALAMRDASEKRMAVRAADNISEVGRAVSAYISANSASLLANQTITLATLRAGGFLPTTFQPGLPWDNGGGYAIRIRRVSTTPPVFEALVTTTTPWSINGDVRHDLLGYAIEHIGGPGGFTYNNTDGAFGAGATWNATVASFPETAAGSASATDGGGLLAYYVSTATNPNDQLYLRRDGSNTMLGALQMNNNNVVGANAVNAASVTATGAVNAASVSATGAVNAATVTASGAVTAATVTASGVVQGGTVTSLGNVNVGPGGNLQSSGRLNIQAGDTLYLQPFANAGGSQTIVGGFGGSGNMTVSNQLTATNDIVLPSLASRGSGSNPTTTSIRALAPRVVDMGFFTISAHGQTVPKPICIGGGVARATVMSLSGYGFVDAGRFGMDVRVQDSGTFFTFIARDQAGNPMPSANIPAGQFYANVRTFCQY